MQVQSFQSTKDVAPTCLLLVEHVGACVGKNKVIQLFKLVVSCNEARQVDAFSPATGVDALKVIHLQYLHRNILQMQSSNVQASCCSRGTGSRLEHPFFGIFTSSQVERVVIHAEVEAVVGGDNGSLLIELRLRLGRLPELSTLGRLGLGDLLSEGRRGLLYGWGSSRFYEIGAECSVVRGCCRRT